MTASLSDSTLTEILTDSLPDVELAERPGYRASVDAATREEIAWLRPASLDDVDGILDTASAAKAAWAGLDPSQRNQLLIDIADDIDAHAEALARLLSRESGKPLNGPNARFEVGACSLWLRATAELELLPEQVFQDGEREAYLHYEPLGVVSVIGPWNWPMMIAIWQIAPALKMGNTVVVKPSTNTPLSVAALIGLLNRHLPTGVLSCVIGGREVGGRLVSDRRVAKVMFTGSTPTGQKIVEQSADNLARLTLELGGNDPAIVLPDVDPAAIAEDLFWGAFVNTGQTCAAIKRLYVHADVHDEVVERLAALARTMPMGNGLDEQNVLGPLQNQQQFDIVKELVDDAIAAGGEVVAGGQAATDLGPLFFQPTLITGLNDGVRLVDEEQFGPALPIIRYTDVDQAVASANGLNQGLAASIWSADVDWAKQTASRIEAGTVWINQHAQPNPLVPFGGVKGSGYGVEFGLEGLKAVSRPQIVSY